MEERNTLIEQAAGAIREKSPITHLRRLLGTE